MPPEPTARNEVHTRPSLAAYRGGTDGPSSSTSQPIAAASAGRQIRCRARRSAIVAIEPLTVVSLVKNAATRATTRQASVARLGRRDVAQREGDAAQVQRGREQVALGRRG